MLQPQIRPDGSTQILRYRGSVNPSPTDASVFPKANAEIPADSAAGLPYFTAWVRFALFDTTDIENERRRFIPGTFDDSQLAGVSPHAPVLTTASPFGEPGINAGEIWIGDRTWAQNLRIHEARVDPRVAVADIGIATSANASVPGGALVLQDTLTSGLGLNTNLPVVAVRFFVVSNNGALQKFEIDMTFEIRHTLIR